MKIALYGYGKMGHVIEACATERGHEIAMRVGSKDAGVRPDGVDVAIEFSRPESAIPNMRLLLAHGVPVVVGTTGWYDRLNEVKDLIREHNGALLYASNFSIGVNLFFKVNQLLAGLMDKQPQYTAMLVEEHHTQKRDAPSGTALSLTRDIILQHKGYDGYALEDASAKQLPITAVRKDDIPGTHRIAWKSEQDEITIEHKAFGRNGFADGAVKAAEWLAAPDNEGQKKTGLFTFQDVLNSI